jgi:hypothetical protein
MNTTTHLVRLIALSTVLWCAPPMLYANGGAEGAPDISSPPWRDAAVGTDAEPPIRLTNLQLEMIVAGQAILNIGALGFGVGVPTEIPPNTPIFQDLLGNTYYPRP